MKIWKRTYNGPLPFFYFFKEWKKGIDMLAVYAYQVLNQDQTTRSDKKLNALLIGEGSTLLSSNDIILDYSKAYLISPGTKDMFFNLYDLLLILRNGYYNLYRDLKQEKKYKEAQVFFNLFESLQSKINKLKTYSDAMSKDAKIENDTHRMLRHIENNFDPEEVTIDAAYFSSNNNPASEYRDVLFNTISFHSSFDKKKRQLSFAFSMLSDIVLTWRIGIDKNQNKIYINNVEELMEVMKNIVYFIDKQIKKYHMDKDDEEISRLSTVLSKTLELSLFHSDLYNDLLQYLIDHKNNRLMSNDVSIYFTKIMRDLKKYKMKDIVIKENEIYESIQKSIDYISRHIDTNKYDSDKVKNDLVYIFLKYFRIAYEKYTFFKMKQTDSSITFTQHYDMYTITHDDMNGMYTLAKDMSHLFFQHNAAEVGSVPIAILHNTFEDLFPDVPASEHANNKMYQYDFMYLMEIKEFVDEVKQRALNILLRDIIDDRKNKEIESNIVEIPKLLPLTFHLLAIQEALYHQYESIFEVVSNHASKNVQINLTPFRKNLYLILNMIQVSKLLSYSTILLFFKNSIYSYTNQVAYRQLDIKIYHLINETLNRVFGSISHEDSLSSALNENGVSTAVNFNMLHPQYIEPSLLLLKNNNEFDYGYSYMHYSKFDTYDIDHVFYDTPSYFDTDDNVFDKLFYFGIPMTRWVFAQLYLSMLKLENINNDTLRFMTDLYNVIETHYVIDLDCSIKNIEETEALCKYPVFIQEQMVSLYTQIEQMKKDKRLNISNELFNLLYNAYRSMKNTLSIDDFASYFTHFHAAHELYLEDAMAESEYSFFMSNDFANNMYVLKNIKYGNKIETLRTRIQDIYNKYEFQSEQRYNAIQMYSLFKELQNSIGEEYREEIINSYFNANEDSISPRLAKIYNTFKTEGCLWIQSRLYDILRIGMYNTTVYGINAYASAINTLAISYLDPIQYILNLVQHECSVEEVLQELKSVALFYTEFELVKLKQLKKYDDLLYTLAKYRIDASADIPKIHNKQAYYAHVIQTIQKIKNVLSTIENEKREIESKWVKKLIEID